MRFNGHRIAGVNGVSLHVKKGAIITLCGKSGSGKTTLLKCLNGSYNLDAGSVTWNGKAVLGPAHNLVPGYEHIKLVHQDFKLLPNHTIFENLALGLKFCTKTEVKSRINEIAKHFEISLLLAKKPKEISGGQQQRAAIAAALIDDPELLLLDEPFSNLDRWLREKAMDWIMAKVKELQQTVVYASHDAQEVLRWGEEVYYLEKGKVKQKGIPEDLYWNPKNELVGRFFGSLFHTAELNFIEGDPPNRVFARMSDLEIKEGETFSVRSSLFLGSHYINTLYTKQHKCHLEVASETKLTEKQKIGLKWKERAS